MVSYVNMQHRSHPTTYQSREQLAFWYGHTKVHRMANVIWHAVYTRVERLVRYEVGEQLR